MRKYVLKIDENTIHKYRVKRIKEGSIDTYKKKTFSLEVSKVYYSTNCMYYVVGNIDPQLEASLEHAQNLFKNRFFRSLMRDKMTFVELMLLGAVIISMVLNFQFYQKIDALLKLIQVV